MFLYGSRYDKNTTFEAKVSKRKLFLISLYDKCLAFLDVVSRNNYSNKRKRFSNGVYKWNKIHVYKKNVINKRVNLINQMWKITVLTLMDAFRYRIQCQLKNVDILSSCFAHYRQHLHLITAIYILINEFI